MKNYKAHILVVDDDDGIRNLVKKFLNEKSFLVNTACSAEDAQKKIAIIKFDLIILDIMMPCLLYTSPSPRDFEASRMPSSA